MDQSRQSPTRKASPAGVSGRYKSYQRGRSPAHIQRREQTSHVSAGKLNVRLVGRRHEKPLWTHETHLAVVLNIEADITQKDWFLQLIAPAMPEKGIRLL